MKDLVEYIVKNIVNTPDAVIVEEAIDQDGSINLSLTVDPSDMGLVIGKSGQTIKSIRRLLITRAMVENKRVSLFLVEPEGSERPARAERSEPETVEDSPEQDLTDEEIKSPEDNEESGTTEQVEEPENSEETTEAKEEQN